MAPAKTTGNSNFNLKNRPDRNKLGPELATFGLAIFMEGQHIIKATFSLVTFSLATLKKVTFGLATFGLATFSLATLCGCSFDF
jgi:hypothetical protein